MHKLQSICYILESRGVWQNGSLLWNLSPEICILPDSTAHALQIVMPVKVLMRSAVALAASWVSMRIVTRTELSMV